MKKGVVIVNTARGAVMDEEPKIHPGLIAAPNAMLLPHMGTWTIETQMKMEIWCIENVRMAVETGKLKSPVSEQRDL